jgi:uncharacterized protein (DUF488 family)
MGEPVYTIGHSTHTSAKLLALLAKHGVTAVADVRSQPYSRLHPQFNRENLQADLRAGGIRYAFLGRELGARTEDRSCYVGGKVQYDLLARTPLFQSGLDRIAHGRGKYRIALLCAERDPLTCHRTILVARHLVARGIPIWHISDSGELESHDDSLSRLLAELGSAEREMFRDREERVRDAYAHRGEHIAYVEKRPPLKEVVRRVAR